MLRTSTLAVGLLISALFSLSLPPVAAAQVRGAAAAPRAAKNPAQKTTVSVELLAGGDGAALHAQEWAQLFERLGVAVRVRQPLLDDKPEIKQRMVGTLRYVTVIGKLDRSGQVQFADRTVRRSDSAELAEWLRELKIYGAQGTPEGKPLWGLDKDQFADVFAALAVKQEAEVEGQALGAALARLAPEKYPVRLTAAAKTLLGGEQATVRQEVAGIGKGTALAIVLNDYGLGYRPLRTPAGTIELAVDPLTVATDAWPIGWDLKETRLKTAPKLYEMVPVELNDVKFTDLMHAISLKSEVPVFVDQARIAGQGIDLDELRVTYPSRRTSWSLLLKSATNPHKLTRRLKIDERGKPLVWITVFEPGRADDF